MTCTDTEDSDQSVLCCSGISIFPVHINTVLQIKRGKRDCLGIIFHISPLKCML